VFLSGSDTWDLLQGVVIEGTLRATGTSGRVGFALAVNSTTGGGCDGCPRDLGPDVGWDRPGNDVDCFSVAANFTPSDCAAACEREAQCVAWTFVPGSNGRVNLTTTSYTHEQVSGGGVGDGGGDGGDRADAGDAGSNVDGVIACAHGKVLTAPYCTLKSPIPTTMVRAPFTTGLPNRSAWWVKNTTANVTVVMTRMLLGLGSDTDSSRKTTVDDVTVVGGAAHGVRCVLTSLSSMNRCMIVFFCR
jgi:hypothetical protein